MDAPIIRAIDDMLSWSSQAQDWLKRAGPVAAEMNREAALEGASPLRGRALVPSGSSPQAVSPVPASIPDARSNPRGR
jgi:hypothetical protein